MPRGYRPVGKNADPQFRSERARRAQAAQVTVDAHIDALVTKSVQQPLTAEQRARLAAVLA